MIKEPYRDYATKMFRTYAEWGCRSPEAVMSLIFEREKKKHAYNDESLSDARAEKLIARYYRKIDDIDIVETYMKELYADGKDYIAKAVEAVYFVQPSRGFRKGDISARVRRFAYEYHVSEKQVYAYLKEARLEVARAKGLDTE